MATLYEKEFTAQVARLIAAGYTIAVHPMCGHQGEIAKVCFEKDGKYYALYLTNEYNHDIPSPENPGDEVRIIFGYAPGDYGEPYSTMWLKNVSEIERRTFYIIGGYNKKNAFITEDKDAAWKAAQEHEVAACR
jgi:hypothetical protein